MLIETQNNYLIVKFWIDASALKTGLRSALKSVLENSEPPEVFDNELDSLSKTTYYTDFDKSDWKSILTNNCKARSLNELSSHIIGYEMKGKYLYLQIDVSNDGDTHIKNYVSLFQAFFGWFGEFIEAKLYIENQLPQMIFLVEDQIILGDAIEDIPRDKWDLKKMKRKNVDYAYV